MNSNADQLKRQIALLSGAFVLLAALAVVLLWPEPRATRDIRATLHVAQHALRERDMDTFATKLAPEFVFSAPQQDSFSQGREEFLASVRTIVGRLATSYISMDTETISVSPESTRGAAIVVFDTSRIISGASASRRRPPYHHFEVSLRSEGGDWLIDAVKYLKSERTPP